MSPVLTTVLVGVNCVEPIFELLHIQIFWIFRVYREQNMQQRAEFHSRKEEVMGEEHQLPLVSGIVEGWATLQEY
jgi:hypothetical protein